MTKSNAPHIDRSGRVKPPVIVHDRLANGHPMPTEMNKPSLASLDEAAKRTGLDDWATVSTMFMSGHAERRAIIAHAWTIELGQ